MKAVVRRHVLSVVNECGVWKQVSISIDSIDGELERQLVRTVALLFIEKSS
jgi:hypothetical protein